LAEAKKFTRASSSIKKRKSHPQQTEIVALECTSFFWYLY